MSKKAISHLFSLREAHRRSAVLSLAALGAWLFASCTALYDPKTGKKIAEFHGDYKNTTLTYGGYSFHTDSMLHSPAVSAYGNAIAKDISTAGAAAVPWSPLGQGAATAAVPAISAFIHRNTTRATPAPKP
ncbi:MAG TPA: hypothetical protein VGJ21_01700 [Terracidiphilus sp.]